MPRGGGSRSRSRPGTRPSSTYAGFGTRPPPAPTAPTRPTTSIPQQEQQKGPGLFKQGAAVAGGVVAGNILTAGLLGPRVVEVERRGDGENATVDPCAKELKYFVDCTRKENDLRLCEGFNEALKACRKEFGYPP